MVKWNAKCAEVRKDRKEISPLFQLGKTRSHSVSRSDLGGGEMDRKVRGDAQRTQRDYSYVHGRKDPLSLCFSL